MEIVNLCIGFVDILAQRQYQVKIILKLQGGTYPSNYFYLNMQLFKAIKYKIMGKLQLTTVPTRR